MNRITKTAIIAFCFTSLICVSCVNQNHTNSFTANSKNINSNISDKNISRNTDNKKDSNFGEAAFGNYKYQYKKDGEQVIAIFAEKFLPRDDTVVVGAIREVIKQTYNENVLGSPSLRQQGGSNKIYLEGKKVAFM